MTRSTVGLPISYFGIGRPAAAIAGDSKASVTGFGGADTSGTASAVTGTSSGGVSSGASSGGPDQ